MKTETIGTVTSKDQTIDRATQNYRNLRSQNPSQLFKSEIEDLYFKLVEENIELKKRINSQNEQLRQLSTKLQRMVAVHKTHGNDCGMVCCEGFKAIIENQKSEILTIQLANEKLTERMKQVNMKLDSAKYFLKKGSVVPAPNQAPNQSRPAAKPHNCLDKSPPVKPQTKAQPAPIRPNSVAHNCIVKPSPSKAMNSTVKASPSFKPPCSPKVQPKVVKPVISSGNENDKLGPLIKPTVATMDTEPESIKPAAIVTNPNTIDTVTNAYKRPCTDSSCETNNMAPALQICEDKCTSQMEELQKKIIFLQEELSKTHDEYSTRITRLERDLVGVSVDSNRGVDKTCATDQAPVTDKSGAISDAHEPRVARKSLTIDETRAQQDRFREQVFSRVLDRGHVMEDFGATGYPFGRAMDKNRVMDETRSTDNNRVIDETGPTDKNRVIDETGPTDKSRVIDETRSKDNIHVMDETRSTDQSRLVDETRTTDRSLLMDSSGAAARARGRESLAMMFLEKDSKLREVKKANSDLALSEATSRSKMAELQTDLKAEKITNRQKDILLQRLTEDSSRSSSYSIVECECDKPEPHSWTHKAAGKIKSLFAKTVECQCDQGPFEDERGNTKESAGGPKSWMHKETTYSEEGKQQQILDLRNPPPYARSGWNDVWEPSERSKLREQASGLEYQETSKSQRSRPLYDQGRSDFYRPQESAQTNKDPSPNLESKQNEKSTPLTDQERPDIFRSLGPDMKSVLEDKERSRTPVKFPLSLDQTPTKLSTKTRETTRSYATDQDSGFTESDDERERLRKKIKELQSQLESLDTRPLNRRQAFPTATSTPLTEMSRSEETCCVDLTETEYPDRYGPHRDTRPHKGENQNDSETTSRGRTKDLNDANRRWMRSYDEAASKISLLQSNEDKDSEDKNDIRKTLSESQIPGPLPKVPTDHDEKSIEKSGLSKRSSIPFLETPISVRLIENTKTERSYSGRKDSLSTAKMQALIKKRDSEKEDTKNVGKETNKLTDTIPGVAGAETDAKELPSNTFDDTKESVQYRSDQQDSETEGVGDVVKNLRKMSLMLETIKTQDTTPRVNSALEIINRRRDKGEQSNITKLESSSSNTFSNEYTPKSSALKDTTSAPVPITPKTVDGGNHTWDVNKKRDSLVSSEHNWPVGQNLNKIRDISISSEHGRPDTKDLNNRPNTENFIKTRDIAVSADHDRSDALNIIKTRDIAVSSEYDRPLVADLNKTRDITASPENRPMGHSKIPQNSSQACCCPRAQRRDVSVFRSYSGTLCFKTVSEDGVQWCDYKATAPFVGDAKSTATEPIQDKLSQADNMSPTSQMSDRSTQSWHMQRRIGLSNQGTASQADNVSQMSDRSTQSDRTRRRRGLKEYSTRTKDTVGSESTDCNLQELFERRSTLSYHDASDSNMRRISPNPCTKFQDIRKSEELPNELNIPKTARSPDLNLRRLSEENMDPNPNLKLKDALELQGPEREARRILPSDQQYPDLNMVRNTSNLNIAQTNNENLDKTVVPPQRRKSLRRSVETNDVTPTLEHKKSSQRPDDTSYTQRYIQQNNPPQRLNETDNKQRSLDQSHPQQRLGETRNMQRSYDREKSQQRSNDARNVQRSPDRGKSPQRLNETRNLQRSPAQGNSPQRLNESRNVQKSPDQGKPLQRLNETKNLQRSPARGNSPQRLNESRNVKKFPDQGKAPQIMDGTRNFETILDKKKKPQISDQRRNIQNSLDLIKSVQISDSTKNKPRSAKQREFPILSRPVLASNGAKPNPGTVQGLVEEDTDREISSMTDLPSEKDARWSSRSPGEDKPTTTTTTSYSGSTIPTTADRTAYSEGEMPQDESARQTKISGVSAKDTCKCCSDDGQECTLPMALPQKMEKMLEAISLELARCRRLLMQNQRSEEPPRPSPPPRPPPAPLPSDISIALRRASPHTLLGDTVNPRCIFTLHIGTIVLSDQAVMASRDLSLVMTWQFHDQSASMTRMRTGRVLHFDFSTEYDVKLTEELLNYLKYESITIKICEINKQNEPFATCSLPLRDALQHVNRRADTSLAMVGGRVRTPDGGMLMAQICEDDRDDNLANDIDLPLRDSEHSYYSDWRRVPDTVPDGTRQTGNKFYRDSNKSIKYDPEDEGSTGHSINSSLKPLAFNQHHRTVSSLNCTDVNMDKSKVSFEDGPQSGYCGIPGNAAPSGYLINDVPTNIPSPSEMKRVLAKGVRVSYDSPEVHKPGDDDRGYRGSKDKHKMTLKPMKSLQGSMNDELDSGWIGINDTGNWAPQRVSNPQTWQRRHSSLQMPLQDSDNSFLIRRQLKYLEEHPNEKRDLKDEESLKKVKIENGKPKQHLLPLKSTGLEAVTCRTVEITIQWLALNEECYVMTNPSVQRLYVAYSFLEHSGAELETPISLPKPKKGVDKCIFNFRKTFQLEESELPKLARIARLRIPSQGVPDKRDCIAFTVVSEPTEDPLGINNCEDVGHAYLYIGDLLEYSGGSDSYAEVVPVLCAEFEGICGVLAVKVDGLDVARKCSMLYTPESCMAVQPLNRSVYK